MNLIEDALLAIDAFPYDDFPKIKKEMAPYEKMLDKLLMASRKLPEGGSVFRNASKVNLYTAAKPMFSVLNLTDKKTGGFVSSCIIVYPPYIQERRDIAKQENSFFSDDVIAFSLAHELGHLQQILDKVDYAPKTREFMADQFGALLTAKAGYSVYRAMKGFPVLAAEQESAEHPPLSERRMKLIDFALEHNLINENEKQDAINLRKEIESSVKVTKSKSMQSALANLGLDTRRSGRPQDISFLEMGISRLLATASIEILGPQVTDRVVDYFKDIEKAFVTRSDVGWQKYGVVEYDKLEKDGIIDHKGRVLDLQKLQQSSLVMNTPKMFHYAGGMPLQLCQAPSLNSSESKGRIKLQRNDLENG